ncbi:MAG: hypothetical protein ABRQ39_29845 [Candidatus Eremiobacterota bacterium]
MPRIPVTGCNLSDEEIKEIGLNNKEVENLEGLPRGCQTSTERMLLKALYKQLKLKKFETLYIQWGFGNSIGNGKEEWRNSYDWCNCYSCQSVDL